MFLLCSVDIWAKANVRHLQTPHLLIASWGAGFTLSLCRWNRKQSIRWHASHQRAFKHQNRGWSKSQVSAHARTVHEVWTKMSRWHHRWHISANVKAKSAWCSPTWMTTHGAHLPDGGKGEIPKSWIHCNLNKATCDRHDQCRYQFTSLLIRLVRQRPALPKDPTLTGE